MNESVRVSLILVSSIRQTNRSAFNRSATHGNLPPSMEEDYVRALSYGMPPAGGEAKGCTMNRARRRPLHVE